MEKLIWLLFSINMLSQANTCIFVPFFPSIALEEKGVSLFMVGLTMSIWSVAFVIFSYIAGHLTTFIGRRLMIYLGLAISGVGVIGFGLIYWVSNRTLFISLALILRFAWGLAQAMINVALYAIASIKYKDSLQQKVGLLEAGNGAGFLAGPLFGGIIYQFTHYWVPFFIGGFILFAQIYFLRQHLDESWDLVFESSHNKEVTYGYLLKHKRVLFAVFAQFLNIFIQFMH